MTLLVDSFVVYVQWILVSGKLPSVAGFFEVAQSKEKLKIEETCGSVT